MPKVGLCMYGIRVDAKRREILRRITFPTMYVLIGERITEGAKLREILQDIWFPAGAKSLPQLCMY